jgi:YgiT-type zinc finger domain-containing protein
MKEQQEKELILCDICGARAARAVKRPQVLGRGAEMILVDNVPVIACRNCGESYMTGQTIHQLDKLRSRKKTKSSKRKIAVAEFVYD